MISVAISSVNACLWPPESSPTLAVMVWVAMCGDGLLALGTLGLFLARIYRNREVDWLLLFVAVMMVLLAANHWEIAQSHPIAG